MKTYLAHRFIQSLLVLLFVSFVSYSLIGLMPGDPIDLMFESDPTMTPADVARMKALYGLDQPLITRYWHWLTSALQGDFGYSRLYSQPAIDVLIPAVINTLKLVGFATFFSLAIAIPVGIIAALKHRSWADYLISFTAFVGFSTPAFWLALMLILLFSVTLGWFPAGGTGQAEGGGFWLTAKHMVLPTITLTVLNVASHSRYVRGTMLEVMRQDYIRTAKAKGADNKRVVIHHALRNAMIPLVTIVALDIGFMLSGALITETIFAWPGMGKLIFDAIMGNDYNLALLGLMVITFTALLGNLVADLLYAKLDPRISLSRGATS
ncbi:ABC transporter permease [bacterium 19MO03SA05]|uniref:ABC transporter permease n=1 Tax=bacterium 19MO03SA05 TaxID=2920620 RepID=A0AAU6VII0_UNCXX|nr:MULTISPECIES: ABC transporter permease [Vibrio]EKO3573405.1 ABC transporter permease [Vibrio metschnikovii]EKO3891899.1 ABC transporter permease [Vibrio metschnikovii]EKO3912837.1 ABC transporter permease [Vibrio metschnikovii]EKO3920813.1 ABC transporter permease [Vibrio metschnikovii]MDQ2108310.1 ABC transporter permease [Vibrio sp. 2017_1457_15]